MLDGLTALRIYWSSKFVALDRLIVYDKSFGEWIVKPGKLTRTYLGVEVRSSDKALDKLDVTVRTVVRLDTKNPQNVSIIIPKELPPLP